MDDATHDVDAILTLEPGERPIFRVRDVRKVYGMGEVEVHALRSIDLDVRRGELLVMLGASGSGKSTLLNILGGLDVPISGTVFFEDRDLAGATESERTRYRREKDRPPAVLVAQPANHRREKELHRRIHEHEPAGVACCASEILAG